MSDVLIEVMQVYQGSDGELTMALYKRLEALGPAGIVATNLFRACKNSERATKYRGGVRGQGSYRKIAYERKQWAMENLCTVLAKHGESLGIRWGWGVDREQARHDSVLYVEAPTGQVSFHTDGRGRGPEYPGVWDEVTGQSAERICRYCAQVLTQQDSP